MKNIKQMEAEPKLVAGVDFCYTNSDGYDDDNSLCENGDYEAPVPFCTQNESIAKIVCEEESVKKNTPIIRGVLCF